MAPALLLVAHGSPDPDWSAPLQAVRDEVRALLPGRPVELCFLGHTAPDLDAATRDLVVAGAIAIRIVALLMSTGGRHMQHDLPAAVARLRALFPGVAIELSPTALGAEPAVISAFARAAWGRS
jgi:sirohydrochlorin ferrochelatase